MSDSKVIIPRPLFREHNKRKGAKFCEGSTPITFMPPTEGSSSSMRRMVRRDPGWNSKETRIVK